MCSHTKIIFTILLIFSFSSQSFAVLSEGQLINQLRADSRVLLQAQADLEHMRSSRASAGDIADMENWIQQRRNQMATDCRELSSLAAASIPADLPCKQLQLSFPATANINTASELTQGQKTKKLEDQLNSSLGEFDETLLREQDRIKARAPRADTATSDSASSASTATDVAGTVAGDPGNATEGPQNDKRKSGGEENNKKGESNEEGKSGRSAPMTKSSAPKDIPDGSDDDVIARQIREAAENETDPELKKKLWDEYRRYRDAIK
jgi:hypothetical protein